MLSVPQTDLVAHMEALRLGLVPRPTELVPVVVGPYAAQLLHMAALAHAVPALWVDVQTATVEAESEGGELYAGDMTAELVLATVNAASHGAGHADGLALASWALRALLVRPILVAGQWRRPVGPVRFARIASDETYWAGRITADLAID